jgi:hypothetical protein
VPWTESQLAFSSLLNTKCKTIAEAYPLLGLGNTVPGMTVDRWARFVRSRCANDLSLVLSLQQFCSLSLQRRPVPMRREERRLPSAGAPLAM